MRKNLDCLDNINICIGPAAVMLYTSRLRLTENTEATSKVDRSEDLHYSPDPASRREIWPHCWSAPPSFPS